MVPFVAPAVAEFLACYPNVMIDLTMGEREIDMIDEAFDLAIRLTPPPDSRPIVRNLATWRHLLCCSPSYLEKCGTPLRLSELSNHNCLHHALYAFGDDWHFLDPKGAPLSVHTSGKSDHQ